jgi:FkbM family methyltransferase
MRNPLTYPVVNRPFTRLIRPLARFLPTHVLWRFPVVGVVEMKPPGWSSGVLMADDGADHVASMLFWRGIEGWEPTTIRLFLDLLSPGATVIDVGANSGLFSLLAAARHPTVRVHAVEPAARVFSLLEANVRRNRLTNVVCHRAACGDAAGTVTLHVPVDERVPMMASLVPQWCPGPHAEEQVECLTLDGLVDRTGSERVDIVKIDAEGSEDAVLRGAARTLVRDRPFVLCEVLDRRDLGLAITQLLAGHDYCFFALGRDGAKRCAEVRGGSDADESHNYLFAHRSRLPDLQRILVTS